MKTSFLSSPARGVIGLVALLSLAGCSSVYVTAPLGEKPHVLDPAAWAGTWIAKGDAFVVDVIDAEAGELRLTGTELRDGQRRLETATFYIREVEGVLVASHHPPDDPPNQYVWARLIRDDDRILIWSPDVAKFRRLVREGRLRGSVSEKDDVYLAALSPAEAADLMSEKHGVLVDWQKPIVLRRLKPERP